MRNKCKRCNSTNNVKYREIQCKLPGHKNKCTLETFHCESCFKDILKETSAAGYWDIKYDTPI